MIVYINQGTRKLAIRIANRSTGDYAASYEDMQLFIRPGPMDGCDCWEGGSPWYFYGCWPGHPTGVDVANPWKRRDIPTLVYDAAELDDDGRVVFNLDERLDQIPAGRYTGIIQTTPLRGFAFDPDKLLVVKPKPAEKVLPEGYDFPSCGIDYPPAEPPKPPKEACILAIFEIDLGPSCGDHFIDQVVLEPANNICGENDG